MTQAQPLTFVGVKMPPALAGAVKATAAARGVTISDVIRLAVAKDLASAPNAQQTPATPA